MAVVEPISALQSPVVLARSDGSPDGVRGGRERRQTAAGGIDQKLAHDEGIDPILRHVRGHASESIGYPPSLKSKLGDLASHDRVRKHLCEVARTRHITPAGEVL